MEAPRKKRPGPGPQVGFRPRPPKVRTHQKSVRLEPDLIEAVEQRAMRETLVLGVQVDFSTIARRGLEMVLRTPTPELKLQRPCNMVPGAAGDYFRCLTCGSSWTADFIAGLRVGEAGLCPRDMKAVQFEA